MLLVILGFGAQYLIKTNNQTQSQAGEALIAPSKAAYTDLNGNNKVFNDYIGEIIVANSWASWSPSSANELKKLSDINNNLQGVKLSILAINRAEDPAIAQRYLGSLGDLNGVELILDPEDNYYRSIGGYAMPETVVYSKNGSIYYHVRGEIDPEILTQKINELSRIE